MSAVWRMTLACSVDTAVACLIEAVNSYPMGLVAHINGQANAAKKGICVAPDQILEVFRPDFAVKVWAAEKAAGLDIPLRIHVYEAAGGCVVQHRPAGRVFAVYGNPVLDQLAAEIEGVFRELLDTLRPLQGSSQCVSKP
jgi:uncharacterized protein (DUF302 family)